jgi:O-antigen ligase
MKGFAFMALLVFVFSLPLENSVILPGAGTISRLIGVVALMLGVGALFAPGHLKVRRPSLLLVLMSIFVLWSFASYFWSINPTETLVTSVTFVQLLAMAWLVWQFCQTPREQQALLQAYILGALVSTSTSVANFVAGNAQESYSRFSATGFDPNNFATALALGIPIAWFLVSFSRTRVLYWVNLLYIPWAIFVIVLSASRGGFLVMAVALTVIPLTYGSLSLRRKVGFLLLLTVGVYLLFNLSDDLQRRLTPNLERLSSTTTELTEGTLNSRTKIWAAGLQAFIYSSNPWVGSGSGTFDYAVEPFLDRPRASHNAYLSVLVDLGFVGFVLFLSFFLIAVLPVLGTPQRVFYIVLAVSLSVALLPLGWEANKLTWFILSLVTTQRAYVMESVKRSLTRAWV